MAADRPVLIAGGGIGGLALALALAQAAAAPSCWNGAREFETEGAGIQLGPNGVRVLRRSASPMPCAPLSASRSHRRAGRAQRTAARPAAAR